MKIDYILFLGVMFMGTMLTVLICLKVRAINKNVVDCARATQEAVDAFETSQRYPTKENLAYAVRKWDDSDRICNRAP